MRPRVRRSSTASARSRRLSAHRSSPFAYPNGKPNRDYDARHVAMAREAGFVTALTTAWGAAAADSDPFQIPRVAAWDRTPLRYGLRLARASRERNFATV